MDRSAVFFSHDHIKEISSSLLNLSSLRIWTQITNFRRKDTEYCAYVKRFIEGRFFSMLMISTISLNALCMVLQTDYDIKNYLFLVFEVVEVLFVSVYCFEFCIKLYVDPLGYWKNGYNLLDVVIIIILSVPFHVRKLFGRHCPYLNIGEGIQSLRILKLIPYSRGIKTLITALGQTICTVASVMILLFLLMFIFAILGFSLFGSSDGGDLNNWGNLAVAFFTLFSLTTVDGWTDLQKDLDERGFGLSRAFTIFFILLGSFVFLSMFVGVMIFHTEDSIKKFKKELENERHVALLQEKQNILKKQQEEVSRLMQKGTNSEYKTFSELVKGFKKTLRHSDPMVLEDFCTTLPFIDIYLSTLDNQDNTISKLQELYYEMVNVLNQMLDDIPTKKRSFSSEKSVEF
ncbi:cation channel sperm-associated protein 3 isoform X2 [Phascolarctos cinereus]|uniref:Cation channel sperm-associated protein 3 isoform X2 n=1 Tax=Phascolarctos cinereus TaxID=38626 RepID=A0A6P5KQ38_PHACI|nr:cation channel sperm-associated protein 3 isoform X2 [Phascolarctos cinereus]